MLYSTSIYTRHRYLTASIVASYPTLGINISLKKSQNSGMHKAVYIIGAAHMNQVVVAALYQFARLENYQELQKPLKDLCETNGIKGTLLLAYEGINGTVAGSREGIDALQDWLATDGRFNNLEYKESFCEEIPFYRMKVRLKKEIVTLGVPGVDPNDMVGTYLESKEWNELLSDPDVILIDTRNDYEFGIGTFKGAINPETNTFREFPEYVSQNCDPKKHKKVAMFCTGGIRCEKASSYMLAQGFENVYHLKGGILKYLETIPAEESLWEGECFVFDNRVSIKHGLEVGDHTLCHGCRNPLGPEDLKSDRYQAGVTCPKCYDVLSDSQKHKSQERQRQIDIAKQRGYSHLGTRHR